MNVDPTFEPFLTEAIARTGVGRYRHLCLEHPDEQVRREYRALVTDIASGKPLPMPPVHVQAGNATPTTSRSCCGGYNPYGD
jgi:hypothetical protein